MSTLRVSLCLASLGLALSIAGCESTQSKSERLSKRGNKAIAAQKGLKITKQSRAVKILDTAVLSDANGVAAVVVARNTTRQALAGVPISIDVTDGKESLFRNDDPGLEPSLTSMTTMGGDQTMAWVNDQVSAGRAAKKVKAVVGTATGPPPKTLPPLEIGKAKLGGDPTSGVAAEGSIRNKSKLLQRKLVLFAVARRGDKIVAAGRGQVDKLRPGKSAKYQIFFIGNPRGARIEIAAPPTKAS